MAAREITFDQLPFQGQLASYNVFGRFSPAVYKKENGSYSIRIITGHSWNGTGNTFKWDYFELDETGLIKASPRGMASQYNKKVRITDIDAAVEEYKDKVLNQ